MPTVSSWQFYRTKTNTSLTCSRDTDPGTKHPSRDPGIELAENEFILMSKTISQPGMVMQNQPGVQGETLS